mgnify:CR=1 FL=1
MSRLSYFCKRLVKMDWATMWKTTDLLKERSGKSRPWLMCDMLHCAVKYNAGYVDYKIAQMYRLNEKQRATVITRGISNNIVRRMNDKAYWHFFDDKTQFKRLLLEKNIGILEEIVVQHPDMAKLCPTSVNTCRIATLLGDKKQGIVYAFLRIGNGKVMDNVDCGGMAARIDLESGKLLTVGADKQGNTYEKHPMTGTPIVGFTIPYWEEAKAMCLEAAQVVPQMRFVAWDVAITPNGPTFIEGNSFPSHAVPQFAAHYPDGIGILPEFEKFIDL